LLLLLLPLAIFAGAHLVRASDDLSDLSLNLDAASESHDSIGIDTASGCSNEENPVPGAHVCGTAHPKKYFWGDPCEYKGKWMLDKSCDGPAGPGKTSTNLCKVGDYEDCGTKPGIMAMTPCNGITPPKVADSDEQTQGMICLEITQVLGTSIGVGPGQKVCCGCHGPEAEQFIKYFQCKLRSSDLPPEVSSIGVKLADSLRGCIEEKLSSCPSSRRRRRRRWGNQLTDAEDFIDSVATETHDEAAGLTSLQRPELDRLLDDVQMEASNPGRTCSAW